MKITEMNWKMAC